MNIIEERAAEVVTGVRHAVFVERDLPLRRGVSKGGRKKEGIVRNGRPEFAARDTAKRVSRPATRQSSTSAPRLVALSPLLGALN